VKSHLLPVLWLAFLLPLTAGADGSFALADIQKLLDQEPALRDFIAGILDTAEGGLAGRINTGDNPALAGTRIAPYRLKAKSKGRIGDFNLILSIEAETRFFNTRGEEAPLSQAIRVEQRFTSIRLLPIERHLE
jgi:hypothetical protein